MEILIVTPVPPGSRRGNRITAVRWAELLEQLGHQVTIAERNEGKPCDVLVALHACKSHAAVVRSRAEHPCRPIIVALTGTDLYNDIRIRPEAVHSLELADRLIVLQPLGIQALPEHVRARACVIYQSVEVPAKSAPAAADPIFRVCVLGHLRPVKDPLRTALAARLLPATSKIRVIHIGGALSPEMAEQAQAEMASNPRYEWLGELPREQALQVLQRCQLLALTSISEGGANVISEAVVYGVPVVSSRMDGSVGLLGEDYPGYFPVGDTAALAGLLLRIETDREFYEELQRRCRELRPLFTPERERESWRKLLEEVTPRR